MDSPLASSGLDTDPITGLPINIKEQIQKKSEQRRRMLDKSRNLVNDLTKGDGGEIIKEVVTFFVHRVEALIEDDDECQIYQKILGTVDFKVRLGDKIVKNKIGELGSLIF